jgi:gamma-glutamylputrescine oxidase
MSVDVTASSGAPVWGIPAPLSPPRALPRRAEVVVVGGGITGIALLAALRERGADAIVVERHHVAAGASGRNAGFLLAGVAENYARAVHTYGRAVAREVWAFTLRNHDLVAGLAAGIDAGHHRRGSLTIAVDADEAASLEQAATLLAEDGLPGTLVAELPFQWACGALRNPADGEIDPVRLVRGIAAAHAGSVFEGHPVLAVEDGQNNATVHLDGALIEAGVVVLATNAWTAQLASGVPIRPVRAQMLATASTGVRLLSPVYAEWGHRYWRQRDDGSVLIGGFRNRALAEEVGYDVTPTAAVQGHLEAQLAELGVETPITHRWAGTMGFSEDGLPLVGLVQGTRHVSLCAGYTGHGMGFAVNAAAALCGRLLDSTPLPAWLDAARTSRG